MTDISIYIIKPYFNSFCVYWGLSLIYFLCDIFIDEKYRMEGNIDWKLYKKTFYHVLYLQFCFSLPVMYFMIPLWKWRGNSILYEELEYIEIPKLIFTGLLGESLFYYLHYWSHLILYSKIHKVHHEWKNTCAIAAAYAHPIEYMLVSLPTFLLPPLITGVHWYYANIWFILSTASVVVDHSGYRWFSWSEFHWKHHKFTHVNYGTRTLYDIALYGYNKIIKDD
jgi:sterol desaturase/sphingolipid hydroxylase (fatty acid hydroxylase superfamily)